MLDILNSWIKSDHYLPDSNLCFSRTNDPGHYSMNISDYSNLGGLLFECAQSHRLLESISLLKKSSGEMAQDQAFRLPYHPQRHRDASNPNYYFEPQGTRKCSLSFIVAVLLLAINPQCSQNRKKCWHGACHSEGEDSRGLGMEFVPSKTDIFVQ